MRGMTPRFQLAAAAALAVAFASIGSAGAVDPWAKLHRALHLPTVAAGGRCPVSEVGSLNFLKFGVGKGIGPGPVYPIGFEQPGSRLVFAYPPQPNSAFAGSKWSGQKVLWFIAPSYRGPALIRGARLDAPGRLRFETRKVPPLELRIPGAVGSVPTGRDRPSYTRLRAPGCYAYQVDGMTFSRVIVFRAVTFK